MVMTSAVDLAGDTTDFKGEDISGAADVIIDLNGRARRIHINVWFGGSRGVIVIDDLSKDPAVVTGEVERKM